MNHPGAGPRCCTRSYRSRTAPCCMSFVTSHPDRAAHELVFLPDLTSEVRAWPADTWARLEVDLQRHCCIWRPLKPASSTQSP
jgi:hypothetical protein